jgi:hypothetical protein
MDVSMAVLLFSTKDGAVNRFDENIDDYVSRSTEISLTSHG